VVKGGDVVLQVSTERWQWIMRVRRLRLIAEMREAGLSNRRLASAASDRLQGRTLSHGTIDQLVSPRETLTGVSEEVAVAIADVLRQPVEHLFLPAATRSSRTRDLSAKVETDRSV
jgi:hypothetical protein